MAPTAPWAGGAPLRHRARRSGCRFAPSALIGLAMTSSFALAGCSSSTAGMRLPDTSSSTADAAAATDAAILAAWKAAETAFYQAEANPQGLFSPALAQTMVDPELELVKKNLAGQEAEGWIGRGPMNLGTPRVISIGPTEMDPTTATVVSCIHDTQVLVNEHTSQPASGPNGMSEWAGETSTMVFAQGSWKLSQQSVVGNTSRSVACAGIS